MSRANRERNIAIQFYVTQEEKELIEEKMKLINTTNLSAYLRKMAIDGLIVKVDFSEIKETNYELNKIGTNINQIAKIANTTDSIYRKDIEKLKIEMQEIWKLQKKLFNSYMKTLTK